MHFKIIFYLVFFQIAVKLIVDVDSPKKLYHIGESEGLWSNQKNTLNTDGSPSQKTPLLPMPTKIMKSGRFLRGAIRFYVKTYPTVIWQIKQTNSTTAIWQLRQLPYGS